MSFSLFLTDTLNKPHSPSSATVHQLTNTILLLEAIAGHQMVGTHGFFCIHPLWCSGLLLSPALKETVPMAEVAVTAVTFRIWATVCITNQ